MSVWPSWSKALDSGHVDRGVLPSSPFLDETSSPRGRGFESHSRHHRFFASFRRRGGGGRSREEGGDEQRRRRKAARRFCNQLEPKTQQTTHNTASLPCQPLERREQGRRAGGDGGTGAGRGARLIGAALAFNVDFFVIGSIGYTLLSFFLRPRTRPPTPIAAIAGRSRGRASLALWLQVKRPAAASAPLNRRPAFHSSPPPPPPRPPCSTRRNAEKMARLYRLP